MDNQQWRRELDHYRETTCQNAQRALYDGAISLGNLIPSLILREVWPLAQPFFTPLPPFKRSQDAAGQDYIPRKQEPELAQWLTSVLAIEHECAVRFLVIGDSKSDIVLAANLKRAGSKEVHVGIMNRDLAGHPLAAQPGVTALEVCSRWDELEGWAKDRIGELGKPKADDTLSYILLDIDRTTILPRDLCDPQLEEARQFAVCAYIRNRLGKQAAFTRHQVIANYADCEGFPPYQASMDEDQKAIATLLMTCGLFSRDDFSREGPAGLEPPTELTPWIQEARRRLLGNESKSLLSPKESLLKHIDLIERRLAKRVATLVPEYRKAEEQAFKNLDEMGGRFCINRHIVEIIAQAASNGWIPIGYSDRPGISLGLGLDTTYTSWPEDDTSMIVRSVPLLSESSNVRER
jgi:hypothetical protein